MKNNNEFLSTPMNFPFAFMVIGCAFALAWAFSCLASCSKSMDDNNKEIRLKKIEKGISTPLP